MSHAAAKPVKASGLQSWQHKPCCCRAAWCGRTTPEIHSKREGSQVCCSRWRVCVPTLLTLASKNCCVLCEPLLAKMTLGGCRWSATSPSCLKRKGAGAAARSSCEVRCSSLGCARALKALVEKRQTASCSERLARAPHNARCGGSRWASGPPSRMVRSHGAGASPEISDDLAEVSEPGPRRPHFRASPPHHWNQIRPRRSPSNHLDTNCKCVSWPPLAAAAAPGGTPEQHPF
mmetsp:Transcript_16903/g.40058  ORF Transcript_16903/g.40058 Transcript_16903/m.40058 type:complete len:233 (-) Transcript_16903:49-747(-)